MNKQVFPGEEFLQTGLDRGGEELRLADLLLEDVAELKDGRHQHFHRLFLLGVAGAGRRSHKHAGLDVEVIEVLIGLGAGLSARQRLHLEEDVNGFFVVDKEELLLVGQVLFEHLDRLGLVHVREHLVGVLGGGRVLRGCGRRPCC